MATTYTKLSSLGLLSNPAQKPFGSHHFSKLGMLYLAFILPLLPFL